MHPILCRCQFVTSGCEDASSAGGVDELAVLVIGRDRRTIPLPFGREVPRSQRCLRGQRLPSIGGGGGGGFRGAGRTGLRRKAAARRDPPVLQGRARRGPAGGTGAGWRRGGGARPRRR